MSDDPIYDNMNLAPIPKKSIELIPRDLERGESLEDDLDHARENVHNLMDVAQDVLDEIKGLAHSSQDPKAYREFAVLMKVLLDANKQKIDIVSVQNDIHHSRSKVVPDNPVVSNTTNNLFVGSTSEALDMMRKKQEEGGSDGQ